MEDPEATTKSSEGRLSLWDMSSPTYEGPGSRLLSPIVSVLKFLIQPKILLTLGYCVSFASLGLVLAALGPVLLDLGMFTIKFEISICSIEKSQFINFTH